MGTLIQFVRPDFARLLLGFIALLSGGGIALFFPQLIQQMIDGDGRIGGDLASFVRLVGGLIIVLSVCNYVRTTMFTVVGERIVARVRVALFESIMYLPMVDLDAESSGALSTRLVHDAQQVQDVLSVLLGHAVRYSLMAIGGTFLMFWMAPNLSILVLFLVPLLAILSRVHGRKVQRLGEETSDALASAMVVAEESIRQVGTVRTLGVEGDSIARYRSELAKVVNIGTRRGRACGVFSGMMGVSRFGGMAAVTCLGVIETRSGALSIGDLGAFVMYAMLVSVAIGDLASCWASFAAARGSCRRVVELLGQPREPEYSQEPGQGELTLSGVGFAYPGRPELSVLAEVGFTIRPGELLAVVGASGAGKSTLVQVLTRLRPVDTGAIHWGGVDLARCGSRAVRSQIAVVSQEPVLFQMSLIENIRLGCPGASDEEVREAARSAGVMSIIDRLPLGFNTRVGVGGASLSGGERQRIAIARALISKPRLLILDEATSALDTHSEALFRESLSKLSGRCAVLMITHRIDQAQRADRVIVLDNGRVVQQGNPDQLGAVSGVFQELLLAGENMIEAA